MMPGREKKNIKKRFIMRISLRRRGGGTMPAPPTGEDWDLSLKEEQGAAPILNQIFP